MKFVVCLKIQRIHCVVFYSSYFVLVTSDMEEVAASVTKLEMMELFMKTANVKHDECSWIAAEIEVRYNINSYSDIHHHHQS